MLSITNPLPDFWSPWSAYQSPANGSQLALFSQRVPNHNWVQVAWIVTNCNWIKKHLNGAQLHTGLLTGWWSLFFWWNGRGHIHHTMTEWRFIDPNCERSTKWANYKLASDRKQLSLPPWIFNLYLQPWAKCIQSVIMNNILSLKCQSSCSLCADDKVFRQRSPPRICASQYNI